MARVEKIVNILYAVFTNSYHILIGVLKNFEKFFLRFAFGCVYHVNTLKDLPVFLTCHFI